MVFCTQMLMNGRGSKLEAVHILCGGSGRLKWELRETVGSFSEPRIAMAYISIAILLVFSALAMAGPRHQCAHGRFEFEVTSVCELYIGYSCLRATNNYKIMPLARAPRTANVATRFVYGLGKTRATIATHGLSEVVTLACRDVCRDGFAMENVADASKMQVYIALGWVVLME